MAPRSGETEYPEGKAFYLCPDPPKKLLADDDVEMGSVSTIRVIIAVTLQRLKTSEKNPLMLQGIEYLETRMPVSEIKPCIPVSNRFVDFENQLTHEDWIKIKRELIKADVQLNPDWEAKELFMGLLRSLTKRSKKQGWSWALLVKVVFTTAVYCYHITSIGRTDKIVPTIDCLMEFMKESGAESWAIAAGGWGKLAKPSMSTDMSSATDFPSLDLDESSDEEYCLQGASPCTPSPRVSLCPPPQCADLLKGQRCAPRPLTACPPAILTQPLVCKSNSTQQILSNNFAPIQPQQFTTFNSAQPFPQRFTDCSEFRNNTVKLCSLLPKARNADCDPPNTSYDSYCPQPQPAPQYPACSRSTYKRNRSAHSSTRQCYN